MNDLEIRRWYEVIKTEKSLVEIRILDGKKIYSGYFKDVDTLIERIYPYDNCNIYFTLNSLTDQCESCTQFNTILSGVVTTKADDVTRRDWILIDFDPIRKAGISSSDAEKEKAYSLMRSVNGALTKWGFPEPVICDSGNGYHLLYKCELDNEKEVRDENTSLIKDFLKALAVIFDDGVVDIDTAVFDPNRICKLYGTMARKGRDTKERPHRLSKILSVPSDIKAVSPSLLRKVADMLNKEEKPTYENRYLRERFDIDSFIQRHGIDVQKEVVHNDGCRKIVLKECPFDSNHKAPDSAIFVMPSGAIAFKCFHNSCANHDWRALRLLYEPNAYQNKQDYTRTTKSLKTQEKRQETQVPETDGSEWLSVKDIVVPDREKMVYVPSGFYNLDAKVLGFCLGETTIWSGNNSSGKSTLLNTVCLNAVDKGYKVGMWSGELPAHRLKNWLLLTAAGASGVEKGNGDYYYTRREVVPQVEDWLNNKLWIYNNKCGNRWDMLLDSIRRKIESDGLNVIVIDNLMALDIEAGKKDLENQKLFVLSVQELAQSENVHIHLVCHPRKSISFLRKTDIAGSADISNAIDNVIIVHRNNQDFKRSVDEFYPRGTATRYADYGNVMEYCKGRYNGLQDELFPLCFDVSCKRFYFSAPIRRTHYDKDGTEFTELLDDGKTPPEAYSWYQVYKESAPVVAQDLPDEFASNDFDTDGPY